MKNKKIICKNCGEEISNPKVEICVKCGVRVRQNKVVKIFVILFIIAVLVVGSIFGVILVKNLIDESRRKSYIGTWELQTNETLVYYEKKSEDPFEKDKINIYKHELIIDETLEITDENAYYGIGRKGCGLNKDNPNGNWEKRCPTIPPVVRLNTNDKIVAIGFVSPDGHESLLCFKRDGDMITQIKCGTANSDKYNTEGLYSLNGGINEEFNIVYKKIK